MKYSYFLFTCVIFFKHSIFACNADQTKNIHDINACPSHDEFFISKSFFEVIERNSEQLDINRGVIEPIADYILENNLIEYYLAVKKLKLINGAKSKVVKLFFKQKNIIYLAIIEAKIRYIKKKWPEEFSKRSSNPIPQPSRIIGLDHYNSRMHIMTILSQNSYNELPNWLLEKIYFYLKAHTEVISQNKILQYVTYHFSLPYIQADHVVWYCIQRENAFT